MSAVTTAPGAQRETIKVALIRQTWNPYGGAERFVQRALDALRAQGVAVTLIARRWDGHAPAGDLLTCNPFHLGRLWRDWGFARSALRLARRGSFDLVQSHERIPGCSVFRAGDGVHATWLEQRARVLSAPQRLAQRCSPWHRYTLAAEARMFIHPALRAVICNSAMVREDIARRFGVPRERLHVIHNGVDLERFHPRLRDTHRTTQRADLRLDDATPVILYVGSGFERKGVPQLLTALARMRRRDAVLLVVGRDKAQRRLEREAERLGLATRVRFVGPQLDVTPWYGAADVFALPTLYDPFPNAALEALACGLPLLTSTSCGAAELVVESRNGHICDALDVDRMAAHLDALCATGMHMREAARASVAALSSETMARALRDLYQSLLAQPRAAGGIRL